MIVPKAGTCLVWLKDEIKSVFTLSEEISDKKLQALFEKSDTLSQEIKNLRLHLDPPSGGDIDKFISRTL